jgi:hypothetical protein
MCTYTELKIWMHYLHNIICLLKPNLTFSSTILELQSWRWFNDNSSSLVLSCPSFFFNIIFVAFSSNIHYYRLCIIHQLSFCCNIYLNIFVEGSIKKIVEFQLLNLSFRGIHFLLSEPRSLAISSKTQKIAIHPPLSLKSNHLLKFKNPN